MKPLYALALTAFAFSAQAATPPLPAGKQAVQCFVMYKMAADVPDNAAHRADFQKLQNLMTWSMGKNQVTEAQATKWANEFNLAKTDSKKAVIQASNAQIASCNAFAQTQYDAFVKEKSTSQSK